MSARSMLPARRNGAPAKGERASARATAAQPQAAPHLLVQTKLRVGTRGDRYEQEADRAADEVMRSADAVAGAATAVGSSADTPPVQRMCADCARTGVPCDDCEDEHDEEHGPPAVQRKEREGGEAALPARRLIVEDTDTPTHGAVNRTVFLAILRLAVCVAADEELARGGRSTQGCPYLDYWFGLLDRHDAAFIERALRRYAPESRGARSASEYIAPVVSRVRRGVAVWVATGQVTGVPSDLSSLTGEAPSEKSARAVQRKAREGVGANGLSAAGHSSPSALQSSLGAGRALDAGVRGRMESAFGADFSRVRVHADHTAAGLSTSLGARAFTVGEHVAFDTGEYRPGTLVGDALIAHELAHVVQQGAASREEGARDAGATESYNALEHDADHSALGAVASLWRGSVGALARMARMAGPRLRGGVRLQRCSDSRPKICPNGKVWVPMPQALGAGPVCICRWHCVNPPAPIYTDASGREIPSIGCPGGSCDPRYADDDEEVVGGEGTKTRSDKVASPMSTGVGGHFTPISGDNACACIPPSDIAGIGSEYAPLVPTGAELTDLAPHVGWDVRRGTMMSEPPVARDRVAIEGPVVAGGVGTAGMGPSPLETDPAARTVWGTRTSKIYHEEGSPHFEQMQRDKFPNEKGLRMTAGEAEAAGYRKAITSARLDAARRGIAEHEMVKQAMRPSEGQLQAGGWRLVAVERFVDKGQRVDELWVNDTTQRVFVADTYTGLVEPPEHFQKGWDYSKAKQIKAYLDKGYTYDYSVAIKHPEGLQ